MWTSQEKERKHKKHADECHKYKDIQPFLALLDIGKTPVPSLESDFRRVFGGRVQLEIFGALDNFSDDEILQHQPLDGDDTLWATIPPEEQPILISKKFVSGALLNRVNDIRKINAQLIILCCTIRFPELETPFVQNAFDIVLSYIRETVPISSTLGIFIPDDAQLDAQKAFWQSEGYKIAALSMPPAIKDPTITTKAIDMRKLNPDIVLYNCMGYTFELFEKTKNIHSLPSILSVSTVARYAESSLKGLYGS